MGTCAVLLGWKAAPEELDIIADRWPAEVDLVDPQRLGEDELGALLPKVEAVVGSVTAATLDRAPAVRLVHVLGHGIDRLLAPGLRERLVERDITVAKSNPCDINIAEFVVMAMVVLSRRILAVHDDLAHRGRWSEERKAARMRGAMGGELHGKTLGLLGFGSIGRATARLAAAYGMQVGALVRRPERLDVAASGLAFVHGVDQLDAFLGRCDHVVLTAPLTDATRGLMSRERFAAMRPGSYLVNIARGALVDEQALYEALGSGRLAGAALDVWEVEDRPGPRGGYPTRFPIHQYNVLMTPHYSGGTREEGERRLATVGDNLRRFLAGQPLENVADLGDGY